MDTYSDRIHLGKVKVHGAPIKLQKYQRNKMICDFVLKGFTQTIIAIVFRISKSRVQEILRTHFPEEYKLIRQSEHTHKGLGEKKKRNLAMLYLYEHGWPISIIAERFNLSDGRTYQIIKREISRNKKE